VGVNCSPEVGTEFLSPTSGEQFRVIERPRFCGVK
jgi:hypothetical protein